MEMKRMPNVYLCGARLFFTALFSNISLYILINRKYYFQPPLPVKCLGYTTKLYT